jgi:hypothetical protein
MIKGRYTEFDIFDVVKAYYVKESNETTITFKLKKGKKVEDTSVTFKGKFEKTPPTVYEAIKKAVEVLNENINQQSNQ